MRFHVLPFRTQNGAARLLAFYLPTLHLEVTEESQDGVGDLRGRSVPVQRGSPRQLYAV